MPSFARRPVYTSGDFSGEACCNSSAILCAIPIRTCKLNSRRFSTVISIMVICIILELRWDLAATPFGDQRKSGRLFSSSREEERPWKRDRDHTFSLICGLTKTHGRSFSSDRKEKKQIRSAENLPWSQVTKNLGLPQRVLYSQHGVNHYLEVG